MASRGSFRIRFARRALCAGISLFVGALALAQPAGLTPIHGSASAAQAGSVTTVTTANGAGTRHSALDWRSFGVPEGQTVWFAQPDALSTSINRVLGGNPSTIFGTLGSNGRLVLVNPAGIAVGSGAVVDTAGFTASTLAMSRTDAIAGRLRFGAGDSGDFARANDDDRAGPLRVDGRVLARNGDVVLIGPEVEAGRSAVVEAGTGDVVIAAGRTVELTGRGLEGIRLAVRAPEDRAVNLGTLRGDSVAIFAGQLRHSGLVQALSVTNTGGKVVLEATRDGEIQGRVEAGNAGRGGSVLITGETLRLKSTTRIDVSHPAGGGEILVGGGLDGLDARLRNAQEVEVDSGVTLRADATLSGSGGTVVVWSREETRFNGIIQARGTAGGNGGLVEVLSAGRTRFGGRVDVDGDGAGGPAAPGRGPRGGSDNSGSNNSGPGSAPGNSGSGNSGPGSGNSGSGNSGPGNSGSDNAGSDNAGPGHSGGSPRSGPSRGPLPRVPLAGQSTEVQSGVARPAADTAEFITASTRLLAPGQGGLAGAFDAAARGDSSDGPGAAGLAERRTEPGIVITSSQCRSGS